MKIGLILIVLLIILLIYVTRQKVNYEAYYKYADKEWKDAEKKEEKLSIEKQELQKKLDEIAYVDPVSKIYNMDYFIEKGESKKKECVGSTFTMITFSIANIATLNQILGTREADKVIIYVAKILRKEFQHSVYGHLQSNLFGILLQDKNKQEIQDEIAKLAIQVKDYSKRIPVELVFGIYIARAEQETILSMINNTKVAQKFVKDRTVCNYKYYNEELEATFDTNKKMSEDMEVALQDHKFLMFLQPIIDLNTFQIVAAEGLVRWEYPGKGILSPYAFLPIFEGIQMVKKLDFYMWEEACKSIRRWIDNNIEPIPIHINISAIHLQNLEFIDTITQLLSQYLIDKKYIVLELPENGLMNGNYNIEKCLETLNEKKLRVCVDNFGSLYSPLNLMKNDAIEMIKIDRKFLATNCNSEQGLSLIKYLIAMAKDVEKTVITEGLETIDQVDLLSKIGSDCGQGYFFSKPVDLKTFDSLKKSMVQRVFPVNEFYPTFEQFEKDVDILEEFLNQ